MAAATTFIDKARNTPIITVLSGTMIEEKDNRDAHIVRNQEVQTCSDLQVSVEESDARIIIHIFHAARSGMKCVIVLSNDTDVVVLLLRYMFELFRKGLEEMWIKVGVGDRVRYVPLHKLAKHLGSTVSSSSSSSSFYVHFPHKGAG